jgi:hypothetical protein
VYSENKAHVKENTIPSNENKSISNETILKTPHESQGINGLTGAFISSSGKVSVLGIISLITVSSIILTFFAIKIFWKRTMIIKLR